MDVTPREIESKDRYLSAHRITLLFLFIVGLAIYSNTFDAVAQYDDMHVFAESTLDDLLARCNLGNGRLIADLTFTFNYWLSGPDVLGYHIFNLIVHVFAAFFVYQLLFQILVIAESEQAPLDYTLQSDPPKLILPPLKNLWFWPAFFGGLVFLVHPLATSAVTYITQRYTSLASLFYLASLVSYLKARRFLKGEILKKSAAFPKSLLFDPHHLAWYGIAFVMAVLAMLTKEMSVTLPVMLILLELFFVQPDFSHAGARLLYLMPLLVTGLIVPYHHLPIFETMSMNSIIQTISDQQDLLPRWADKSYLDRRTYFFSQLGIIWSIYLKLLVWPWGQNVEHDFFVSDGPFHAITITASLGLLSLLIIAALTYRKYRLISFGILWFFVALSVTSSVVPNIILVAEHRVYLPMIGLAFSVAGVYRYFNRPRAMLYLVMTIALTLSVLSFVRNSVWKDDLTLWADALKKSPGMARPYNNYARALHKANQLEEAISLYQKVLTMEDVAFKSDLSHKVFALENLGVVYAKKGMYREALESYTTVVRFSSSGNAANTYFNIGNLYVELQQFSKATEAYNKAVSLNPRHYQTHTNLGWLLMSLGRDDEAETALSKALHHNRRAAEAYLNLGNLYSKYPAKKAEAVANYRMYLRLKPDTSLRRNVLKRIRELEAEFD